MAGEFDNNLYCDFTSGSAKALAGKDILLAVFSADGLDLLAVSGQQGLTINRSSDSIEVTSKDTKGGWKSKIAGMKEWSIDNDGLYVPSDETHKALGVAFENGDMICVKVINGKTKRGMFGGLAVITDYSLEAPFDDAMTYSISLDGNGALTDLSGVDGATTMPGDAGEKKYSESQLNAMTKSKIAEIAIQRRYSAVSEDTTKIEMITAFLAAQSL